jgi:hypothetical protein
MRRAIHGLLVIGVLALPLNLSAQTAVSCNVPVGSVAAPTVSAAPPNLVISWKKNAQALRYDVFRRNPDQTCWNITPQGTTATSVADPIPGAVGVYQYQLRVTTSTGPAAISQWTSFDVSSLAAPAGGSAPAATNLTATGTPTTASLTWVAAKGAVNYRVNRAPKGTTTWTQLTATPITATSLTNDVLPDPTLSYTYAVLAYQRNGQFGEAHVDFKAPAPTNPTGLTGRSSGSSVSLSWQAVTYAAGYLVSGPGISGTVRTASTSYSVSAAPDGSDVYRVGSVFDPGAVQTPSSAWSSVTVQVQAPVMTCSCTLTGQFKDPGLGFIKPGLNNNAGTFIHPALGVFSVHAQTLSGYNPPVQLDVSDPQGQSVLSEGNVANWSLSPDNRYFVVVWPPLSSNSGSLLAVYLVQLGPSKWPKIIDATAWPDGLWGFGPASSSVFVITRFQLSTTHQFAFQAFNLLAPTPQTARIDVAETNVTVGTEWPVKVSPCGDRIMYFRYSALTFTNGQADFYRRSLFGTAQTPVIADYDDSVPTIYLGPSAWTVQLPSTGYTFAVQLGLLRERSTHQTSFPSAQCGP